MSPHLFAALILATAALPAAAQTYKWVDEKGQVNYSNTPPPSGADAAQPIEERISIMGMDPAVRAAAERRFAAQEQAEELEYQRRQQAMYAQARSTPAPQSLASSYSSPYPTYYPVYTYGPVFFASAPRHGVRPPVRHSVRPTVRPTVRHAHWRHDRR